MKTMNLLKDFFDDSKKKNSLLSIYDNKNEIDKFYVGYVVDLFDDSILLYSFDENGEKDGYLLIRLVDIFKIEKESIYLNNLSFLIKQNELINKKQSKRFKKESKDGIISISSMCQKNKILLTIKLIYEDYLTGYIVGEDNEYFLIETYSNDGLQNGYNLIEYRDIQNLHFAGKEEENLIKLIGLNKK